MQSNTVVQNPVRAASWLLGTLSVASLCTLVLATSPAAAQVATTLPNNSLPPGFTRLLFGDEFNGTALDRGHWCTRLPSGGGAPLSEAGHPEFNDPTAPPIDAASVTGVYLRKGFDPIPNVRGVSEMDDRIEISEAEVEIESESAAKAIRFQRTGPIWLGLVAGVRFELQRGENA